MQRTDRTQATKPAHNITMSVKSRILQFQQNTPQSQSLLQSSQQPSNNNGTINHHHVGLNVNTTCTNTNHKNPTTISPTRKDPISSINNNCLSKIASSTSTSHNYSSNNNFAHSNVFNGSNANSRNSGSVLGSPIQYNSSTGGYGNPNSEFLISESLSSVNSNSRHLRKSGEVHPPINTSLLTHTPSKGRSANTEAIMSASHQQNPPVNRATKPNLMTKKASMTINLSSNSSTAESSGGPTTTTIGGVGSSNTSTAAAAANPNSSSVANTAQLRPKFGRSPSANRTLLPSPSSAIPKPFGSMASNHLGSNGSLNSSSGGSVGGPGRKSPAAKTTPLSSPSKSTLPDFTSSGGAGTPFGFGSSSGNGRLYGGIGWKEKFEESEKKRNHLVTLAHKATRDYEELRRRYHEIQAEYEKVSRRLDAQTGQLDTLRKASEAVYEDYYKLKKRYEAENREKSDALGRVDQYNKENRRLKRQSAALMMQISDPTSLANAFDAVCETDSAENDKEILYLRSRVQELESKVVDLDSELEKTKLAEFETQESVMLMNDSVNSIKAENVKLKNQLKQLDEENRKAISSLEDVTFEFDSLQANYSINEEKLLVAETELKKILNEKNILQRQSLVFLNDDMDNRLMGALNQIGDLQTAIEEQKNSYEAQIAMLQNHVSETESTEESLQIQTSAKIKALEEEVISLRVRAEEAEQKLEDLAVAEPRGPPPPPPPPMPSLGGPPPPPPPPMMMHEASLNNSLRSAMGTLRKASLNGVSNGSNSENGTPPNGLNDGSPKSIVTTQSPQIDDVVSQIKKGIRLKPTDRTLSRKATEDSAEKKDDTAVEEMRSILNNLRRTRR